jgi:hypothetical protein
VLAGTANLDRLRRHSAERSRTYQLSTSAAFSPARLWDQGISARARESFETGDSAVTNQANP